VAAVFGGLTTLSLHFTVPTGVWLFCIVFLMPGKRSYVNAMPGCLTQEQLRRQERDRAYLPQPPPPPLTEVPRYSAWEDVVSMCDVATQSDPTFSAVQAEPPLSGDYLDTMNRALGIIELQCRSLGAPLPSRTISLDALSPLSESALDLADAPLALKEVIYYHDYSPDAAISEVATGCYYIGEDDDKDFANSADIAALEEQFAS